MAKQKIDWVLKIKQLTLSNVDLSRLPECFGELSHLEVLYLDRLSLTRLPLSLTQLTNLRELSLQETECDTLPESFGNLKNLVFLNLKGCGIRYLFTLHPKTASGLSQPLQFSIWFGLMTNNFAAFSFSINLVRLKNFMFSHCKMMSCSFHPRRFK